MVRAVWIFLVLVPPIMAYCFCRPRKWCDAANVNSAIVLSGCPAPDYVTCCTPDEKEAEDADFDPSDLCPCTHPRDCATPPFYGRLPSDVRDFGLIRHCENRFKGRCCPRITGKRIKKDEEKVKGDEESRAKHFRDTDKICPCRFPSQCPSKPFGGSPKDVGNYGNIVPCINHFKIRCCRRISKRHAGKNCSGSGTKCHGKGQKQHGRGKGQPVNFGGKNGDVLPCVKMEKCLIKFGEDPLDVARFGVLRHCEKSGTVRCVKYNETDHRKQIYIENVLEENGLGAKPPRIYVNGEGTLIVDGGQPLVLIPADESLFDVELINSINQAEKGARFKKVPAYRESLTTASTMTSNKFTEMTSRIASEREDSTPAPQIAASATTTQALNLHDNFEGQKVYSLTKKILNSVNNLTQFVMSSDSQSFDLQLTPDSSNSSRPLSMLVHRSDIVDLLQTLARFSFQ